ncbi:MAG TPA: hypothetical protein VGF67_18750 [Ktedonobacteraceae bacterium]
MASLRELRCGGKTPICKSLALRIASCREPGLIEYFGARTWPGHICIKHRSLVPYLGRQPARVAGVARRSGGGRSPADFTLANLRTADDHANLVKGACVAINLAQTDGNQANLRHALLVKAHLAHALCWNPGTGQCASGPVPGRQVMAPGKPCLRLVCAH